MSLRKIKIGGGPRRRPVAGGPLADVVIGADDRWPVGVVHVTVPPGGAMPAHEHGPSDTTLIALTGAVRVVDVDGDQAEDLEGGSVVTIPRGQQVRVENSGPREAQFLAVFAPPAFVRVVDSWEESRPPEVLDVRKLPPAQRHELIFQTLDGLAVDGSLVLVNDHDPLPLRYQLEATREGDFSWDYEESGPSIWRVRIGRRA